MRRFLPLLALAACAGASSSNAPANTVNVPKQLPPLPAPDHASYDKPVATAPALQTPSADLKLTDIDRRSYEQAQKEFAAGHYRAAMRLLAQLIVAYPDREPLIDDFNAVQKQLADLQSVARTSLDAHAIVTLAAPPATYTLAHRAHVDVLPVPKLVQKKGTKNEIIDDEKWFAANGITRPEYFVPPRDDVSFFAVTLTITSGTAQAQLQGFGYAAWTSSMRYLPADLPAWLPISYGTIPMTHAIDSAPYTIAIYGSRIVAVFDESKKARALFDLEAFTHPPANQKGQAKIGQATLSGGNRPTQSFDITTETNSISHDLMWALAKGQTLFVEHSNLGYAKDSKGQNAYISALDLDTGDLAWRSQPLVANARNFTLVGGGVVAGYGFTAEPDFLFVLDAETGAVKQKTPVPSGPEEIISNGDRVFVRTYDHDLAFDVH